MENSHNTHSKVKENLSFTEPPQGCKWNTALGTQECHISWRAGEVIFPGAPPSWERARFCSSFWLGARSWGFFWLGVGSWGCAGSGNEFVKMVRSQVGRFWMGAAGAGLKLSNGCYACQH